MSTLEDRLASLSPEKRALLLQKLQFAAPKPATVIPIANRAEPLPLSFSQQRLWFLSQLGGMESAYNIATAVHLEGTLHESMLVASFQAILARHEALRTRFVLQRGEPVQVIEPSVPVPLQILDWQALSPADRDRQLAQVLEQEAQTPFNLEQAPLFRLTLVQVSPTQCYLVAVLHHIIADAWSMHNFIQELMATYSAAVRSERSPLLPLTLQYADFAVWQRQWLASAEAVAQIAYWKQQLAAAPPCLELLTDRPRPSVQTVRGQTLSIDLPNPLAQALKQLALQTGTTLFMVLEAAFASLLHRLSGQTDILIGTPVANRNRYELEPLIGFFVNTLVLRNDLSGNPTFLDLLTRTKQMALDAYRHQDVPFEQLVEAVQPARTLSHTPLFQVMFGLQNTPYSDLKLPDVSLSPVPVPNPTAKFDLTLLVNERPDGLLTLWEFNCDLFDVETIARYSRHFQTLLESLVHTPDVSLDQVSLLAETDRQQIIYDWNTTTVTFFGAETLHGGFEQQAELTPGAIALIYDDRQSDNQQMTYQTLNEQANRLAQRLRELGVKPGGLVGICVERSLEMVVGLLAILKAGGAYVPLDPSYPQERLAHMLADSQVPLLLTQQPFLPRLPPHPATVICLDTVNLSAYDSTNLNLSLSPDQLAYVIYTSGSTGKPKGVMTSHRGAVNTNQDINQRFGIGAGDRVLGLASLSFDLSVYDIFGVLAVGGALIMPHAQDALNPVRWLQLMHAHQATLWNTAPAVMEMLIGYVSGQQVALPASLRVVMLSGDAISVMLPGQIRQYAKPSIQVYSFGGATEASIWSICYPIAEVDPAWTSIPYGKPLANQRFHILDAALKPVPIGVPGELHIGGVGVALGYLNRPELTAERFISDPFFPASVQAHPARLYKTGDRGRYLPDGTIQFLGRIDFQVKIRGFRIELGEIEAAVTQFPGVREAAIVVREDQPGNKQICAYLVSQPEHELSIADLRQTLRQKLPDYMVPSFMLALDELPLTSNGKIDRKALPKPEERSTDRAAIALPQTQLERQIAEIWQNVLQVNPIGLHDNFFDLGGQSLLMVRVYSDLQTVLHESAIALGADLSIVDLFQFPTIASLVNHLQHRQTQASAVEQAQQRTEQRSAQLITIQERRSLRQQFRSHSDE